MTSRLEQLLRATSAWLEHRRSPISSLFVPASSIGCAVCDIVIALLCFAGAPAP
jgi:uncharacterized protein DUF6010